MTAPWPPRGIPGIGSTLGWRIILPLRALKKPELAQTEALSPWLQAQGSGHMGGRWHLPGRVSLRCVCGWVSTGVHSCVCFGSREEVRPGEAG